VVEACNRRDAMRAATMPAKEIPDQTRAQNEDLTPEQIAARTKLVDDLRASLASKAPEGSAMKGLIPTTKRELSDEEKADIISELSASKDKPLTISSRFHAFLQEQTAEEQEARSRRNYTASHQNDERAA
jgi:hypothetical protein